MSPSKFTSNLATVSSGLMTMLSSLRSERKDGLTVEFSCFIELNSQEEIIRHCDCSDGQFDYGSAGVFGGWSPSFTEEVGLDMTSGIASVTVEGVSIVALMCGIYSQAVSTLFYALAFLGYIVARQ